MKKRRRSLRRPARVDKILVAALVFAGAALVLTLWLILGFTAPAPSHDEGLIDREFQLHHRITLSEVNDMLNGPRSFTLTEE